MISKAYEALGKWLTNQAPWKIAVLCQCELYDDDDTHGPVLVYACDLVGAKNTKELDRVTTRACWWLIPASIYAAVLYSFRDRNLLHPKPKDEWHHQGVDNAGR